MSSSRPDFQTFLLIIYLKRRCWFSTTSPRGRTASVVRPSGVTHPFTISFLLSDLSRTPKRTMFVRPYGSSQFLRKFFTTLCLFLGVRKLATSADHLKENGNVECYNRTLVARLYHHVFEYQKVWDTYLQRLPYAYNTQKHRATGTLHFNLIFPTNRHLRPHLTDWPALPTICHKTWEHDICHIHFWNGLSWRRPQSQNDCHWPSDAAKVTFMRMHDGNRHSNWVTTSS